MPSDEINDVVDDGGFRALPPTLRLRIDNAFLSVLSERRKPTSPTIPDLPAGGFFRDEDEEEHRSPASHASALSTTSQPTHIPLSLIPAALQHLDLQPDDNDVLSVFKNAASGWSDSKSPFSPDYALVSRKDWRAVCAALLYSTSGDDEDHMPESPLTVSDDEHRSRTPTPDSDGEYVGSASHSDSNGPDDDDDDYHELQGGFVPSKTKKRAASSRSNTRRTRARTSSSPSSSDDGGQTPRKSSARQKQECRIAFALFFPDISDGSLDRQRIRIKDVTRVATLLKEKLTAEEVVEMLDAFSTAPDKSMGLNDFERMMAAAKLV